MIHDFLATVLHRCDTTEMRDTVVATEIRSVVDPMEAFHDDGHPTKIGISHLRE